MSKRKLTEEEIENEIIADSDSDAYVTDGSEESEEGEEDIDEDSVSAQSVAWIEKQRNLRKDFSGAYKYSGGASGLISEQAPGITNDSTPLSVFLLFFQSIIPLLVEETNRYYHQFIDNRDEGPSPLTDVTASEMYVFLSVIIQMGHDIRDSLKDYWSRLEQFYTPFYGQVIARDRFFHILRYLHFTDNNNEPNKDSEDYDRLWKIRTIFDSINNSYAKYYKPSEHLAIDEVIVLFKGRVIFKQYIPKKHKRFGIKIYKLCDSLGYTFDMAVYLGKDRKNENKDITATHGTVKKLTRRIEGVGHKLFMDNFFSSPDLFDDLQKSKINCCGTVRSNRTGMPKDFQNKRLKLKRGDVRVRTRGHLTAVVWKDKRQVHMLTNMHPPPAEGVFCDDQGKPKRPLIIQDYNKHMGYVDKSDRMANSYSISRRSWKWTKKLFFHLLDLTILNSFLLLSSSGGEKSHRNFRLALVRNLLEEGGRKNTSQPLARGRPSPASINTGRLEGMYYEHWVEKGSKFRCRVCSKSGKEVRTVYRCSKCNVGLCAHPCFRYYHTKRNL